MRAANDAPRTAGRPAGRQDHETTYTGERTTPRDRARLILALDGRSWAVADDLEAEAELRALAERLTAALVASVDAHAEVAS